MARKDPLLVGLLWAVLVALGEWAAGAVNFFPTEGARESWVADDAFRLLLRLAVPVFAFVLTMLLYSVFRFRVRAAVPGEKLPSLGPGGLLLLFLGVAAALVIALAVQPLLAFLVAAIVYALWTLASRKARMAPPEVTSVPEGPPIRGNRTIYALWLAITGALAITVIINPGLVGLASIRGTPEADMVVTVEAQRFFWTVSYPQYGVTSRRELVLPQGKRVKFLVTSKDVLHSFWVPAFRVKIDAVPGRTTETYATPEELGSFELDPTFRIQCAELCGAGHALMRMPIRVVTQAEFEAWVEQQRKGA